MRHLFQVPLLALCAAEMVWAEGQPAPISAEVWINTLTLRPFDDRPCAILFFDSTPAKGLRKMVEELNKIARRGDVRVLAVTPDPVAQARKFVEEYRPRFAIGAQSPSPRRFEIRRFPAIVFVKREEHQTFLDPVKLLEVLGEPPPSPAPLPEELSVEELKDRVLSATDSDELESLAFLRIRMDPEPFLSFCDEIEYLKGPISLWWKGRVRYERHLADPDAPVKQSDTSPGRDALRKAKTEGGWRADELVQFLASKPNWTPTELVGHYLDHLGDTDADLVYRYEWASAIEHSGKVEYKVEYVDGLVGMLDVEPDPTIRMRIAGAISDIYDDHPFHDSRIVERLERRLEREDDILWARPMLELAIYQIKNDPPR